MTAKMVEIIEFHPSFFTLMKIDRTVQISLPKKPVIFITRLARSLTAQLNVYQKMYDIPQERNTEQTKLMRKQLVE